MSLSRQEVERIAELAALKVDEEQLPELTRQIGRILEYVSQLEAADTGAAQAVWLGRDRPQALRPDQVRPADLQRDLASMAPAFRDGLVLVPRLAGMEDQ